MNVKEVIGMNSIKKECLLDSIDRALTVASADLTGLDNIELIQNISFALGYCESTLRECRDAIKRENPRDF